MDIQKFLIESIVDTFGNYCECVMGISSLEFDAQFINEDGNTISDLEFIQIKYEEIFIDEIFDAMYADLIDLGEAKEIDLEKIVSFLASKYYIFNYKTSPTVVSFLKICSLDEVVNLFKDNYDFGKDMIKAFFYSLIDEKRYDDNREIIYHNNDQDRLLEYEKKCVVTKISTINSVLREAICDIYNHYINNGYSDIEALNSTWLFFIKGFDPTSRMGDLDDNLKQLYKVYSLCLIFSDLYEDVCNKSIIDSDNYYDRLADMVPLVGIQTGIIGVHADANVRNRMLKHFILLQDEKKKMRENRDKTYKDGRVKQLKKVNPLYVLDELTF
ncbi:MAG: hypothetical protein ACI4XM_05115 [Candidatus Coprovivens sp.]